MGVVNKELKIKAEKLGLRADDFHQDVSSLDELIESISTSGRLYRKSLEHIVLNKVRVCLNNNLIKESDELARLFPRRGRAKKWNEFSIKFDLAVPGLRLTNFAVALLITYALAVLWFLFSYLFSEIEFLVHIKLSGISLWPIFLGLLIPIVPITLVGQVKLPGKTIEDLIDGIIQKNMVALLADDRKEFREMIADELSEE